jgi:hypothetical protein
MIAAARKLNGAYPNCKFILNGNPDLRMFPDDHFDLVYCMLVLQHLPTRAAIATYVETWPGSLRRMGCWCVRSRAIFRSDGGFNYGAGSTGS